MSDSAHIVPLITWFALWLGMGAITWPLCWRLGGANGERCPVFLARPLTLALLGLADFFLRNLFGLVMGDGLSAARTTSIYWPWSILLTVGVGLACWAALIPRKPRQLLAAGVLVVVVATVVPLGSDFVVARILLGLAAGALALALTLDVFRPFIAWPTTKSLRADLPPARVCWRDTLRWEGVGVGLLLVVMGYHTLEPLPVQRFEQFADMASLATVAHAPTYPPNDFWLSQETFNYHYAGFIVYARLGDAVGHLLRFPPPPNALGDALSPLFSGYVFGFVCTFAIGMLATAGVAVWLTRRWWAGVLAVLGLYVAGNLVGLSQVMSAMERTRTVTVPADANQPAQIVERHLTVWEALREMDIWKTSRVLVDKVAPPGGSAIEPAVEYPLFSYWVGDLHPHILNLPIVIAVAGVLAALLTLPGWPGIRPTLCLAALVSFALVSHPLDSVSLGLICLAGLAARCLPAVGQNVAWRELVIPTAGVGLIVAVSAWVTLSTFTAHFQTPVRGIVLDKRVAEIALEILYREDEPGLAAAKFALSDVHRDAKDRRENEPQEGLGRFFSNGVQSVKWVDYPQSRLSEWWLLWGFPLALLATAMWGVFAYWVSLKSGPSVFLVSTFLLLHASFMLSLRNGQSMWPLIVCMTLGVVAVVLAWLSRDDRRAGFAFLMAAAGLVLVGLPEIVSIQDRYGDAWRFNTVFKLFHTAQFWVVLGGLILAVRPPVRVDWTQRVLLAPAVFLGLACLVTSAGIISQRWQNTYSVDVPGAMVKPGEEPPRQRIDFLNPAALDGTRWIRRWWPERSDITAGAWLLQNPLPPGQTLLEAPVEPRPGESVSTGYNNAGRLSLFGDVPSVLSWPNHHLVRRPDTERGDWARRADLIAEVYRAPDTPRSVQLLNDWRVGYVAVGGMERQLYGPDTAERFERAGWVKAVELPGAVILTSPETRGLP